MSDDHQPDCQPGANGQPGECTCLAKRLAADAVDPRDADLAKYRAVLDPDNEQAVECVTDELSGWPIDSGYSRTAISRTEAGDMAGYVLAALAALVNEEGTG